MVSEKELFFKILNHKNYYRLMYPCGMGGEWLTNIVGRESNEFQIFKTVESDVFKNVDVNRHHSQSPNLFRSDILTMSNADDFDTIFKNLISNCEKQKINVTDEISKMWCYLETNNTKHLFRHHLLFNKIFNNTNSYVIHFQNVKTFKKYDSIGFLKILNSKYQHENFKLAVKNALSTTRHFLDDAIINKYHQLLNDLNTHRVADLSTAVTHFLYEPFKYLNNDFFFSNPADECLLDMYRTYYLENQEIYNYINYQISNITHSNNRNILFIELFKNPGYLENIFNLKRDISFDFLKWDSENISLLKRYNFNEYL